MRRYRALCGTDRRRWRYTGAGAALRCQCTVQKDRHERQPRQAAQHNHQGWRRGHDITGTGGCHPGKDRQRNKDGGFVLPAAGRFADHERQAAGHHVRLQSRGTPEKRFREQGHRDWRRSHRSLRSWGGAAAETWTWYGDVWSDRSIE